MECKVTTLEKQPALVVRAHLGELREPLLVRVGSVEELKRLAQITFQVTVILKGALAQDLALLAQFKEVEILDIEAVERWYQLPNLSRRTRITLAGDARVATPILHFLYQKWGQDAAIREALARNSSTPAALLVILSQDEDVFVRVNALENRSMPEEVLQRLVAQGTDAIRAAIAGNRALPRALWERLASDRSERVRWALASNQVVRGEILERLANDPDPFVRQVAQERLQRLARSDLENGGIRHGLQSKHTREAPSRS